MVTKFKIGDVVKLTKKDHEGLPEGATGTISKIVTDRNNPRKKIRILLELIDVKDFRHSKVTQWYVDEDILEFNAPIMLIKTTKEQR